MLNSVQTLTLEPVEPHRSKRRDMLHVVVDFYSVVTLVSTDTRSSPSIKSLSMRQKLDMLTTDEASPDASTQLARSKDPPSPLMLLFEFDR